jgi:Caspase domain
VGAASHSDHGFFTGAILKSLNNPATDTNGDGVIELSELIRAVTLRVGEASSGKQTPWVARSDMFGDFPVASTPGR